MAGVAVIVESVGEESSAERRSRPSACNPRSAACNPRSAACNRLAAVRTQPDAARTQLDAGCIRLCTGPDTAGCTVQKPRCKLHSVVYPPGHSWMHAAEAEMQAAFGCVPARTQPDARRRSRDAGCRCRDARRRRRVAGRRRPVAGRTHLSARRRRQDAGRDPKCPWCS